jgi:hypothetical protein
MSEFLLQYKPVQPAAPLMNFIFAAVILLRSG